MNSIRPRVTVTRSMPMSQWDQQQSQIKPTAPKSFADKKQELKDKVVLQYLEKKYKDALNDDKGGALSTSTNDSLIH